MEISLHFDSFELGAIVFLAESWQHLPGLLGSRKVGWAPTIQRMALLRGSFWVFVLYDVAEEIRIEKLRELVGAETARPQPSFKHPAPEYVRFERPPAVEYPAPLTLGTGEQFEVRIKYFDYGVVSIELQLEFESNWDELVRLSNRWILAPELEGRTAELLRPRLEKAAPALTQPYSPRLNEDY